VIPHGSSPFEERRLKDELLALFWPKARATSKLQAAFLRLNMVDSDSIAEACTKFGLDAPQVAGRVLTYDPLTGRLLDSPQSDQEGRRDLFLCYFEGALSDEAHRTLMAEFRGSGRVLGFKRETIVDKYARLNLAGEIAKKAGATLWALRDLPGLGARSRFIGIDAGADHRNHRQKLVAAIFAADGTELVTPRSVMLSTSSERIPLGEIRSLAEWSRKLRPRAPQLIVHRDGGFLPGEHEDFLTCFATERLTLVAVKKHPVFRLSRGTPGSAGFKINARRALVVTNDQAYKTSCPEPLELEIVHSEDLSIDQISKHVFWLARMEGGLFHQRRLPITIERANNLAGTGSKKYRKSFR
jgi:hypothetical protein